MRATIALPFIRRFIRPTGLAVAIALATAGCGNTGGSPEEHFKKAQSSFTSMDLKATEIELKNALQLKPDYTEARFLLGKLYLLAGNGQAAAKELRHALDGGSPGLETYELLGDALLLQGSADEVLTRFISQPADTADIKALKLAMLADAYFQLKDKTRATEHFNEALRYQHTQPRALLGLARVAILDGDFPKAQQLIDEVIKSDQDNIRAWLTKADLLRAERKTEEAIKAFEEALKHTRGEKDYFHYITSRNMAFESLTLGDINQADRLINELKAGFYKGLVSHDLMLNYVQAFLAYNAKDLVKAKEHAEKVANAGASFPGVLLLLGSINTQTKNYEQAETQLKDFLTKVPGHLPGRKLLAYVQVLKKNPEQAVATLQSAANSETPDLSTLALIANAALLQGNASASAGYFEKALEQKPDEVPLIFGLAQSKIVQQDFAGAIAELQRVPEDSNQHLLAQLAIAETFIKSKDYTSAINTLSNLSEKDQNSALIRSLRGSIALLQNDFAGAKSFFNSALETTPGYAPALRQLAITAIRENDEATALKHFEAAIKANPDHSDLKTDYGSYLTRLKQFEKAEKVLREAQQKAQQKGKSSLALAQLYTQQGKPSLAIAELSLFSEDNQSPEMMAELGNARMMQGEFASALAAYSKLADRTKSHIAYFLMHSAQRALQQKSHALQSLEKALVTKGDYMPALVASAELLIEEGKIDKAIPFINRAEQADPTHAAVSALKGEVALQNRQFKDAIKLYEQSYAIAPNNLIAQKVTQAYLGDTNPAGAISFIKNALVEQKDNAQLNFYLAGLELEQNNTPAAIAAYEKTIALAPNNPIALNNLAWLLKDSDTARAKALAEKALALAPDNSSIKDTLNTISLLEK